jgi:hypothetical protein
MSNSQIQRNSIVTRLTNTHQPDAQSLDPTEEQRQKLVAPDQTIKVMSVLSGFNHQYLLFLK